MKITIAPDKFKGSLTAKEVAVAVARGLRKIVSDAEIHMIPMADGGEGTVEALAGAGGGKRRRAQVEDPLGLPVEAEWAILDNPGMTRTAVIEMSAASGLKHVLTENHPLEASTFGTGQLIREALDAGCEKIIIGIGGSATTDGGQGMAEALGAVFVDKDGRRLSRGGGALRKLARMDLSDLDSRLKTTEILVATDVDNPLCGPNGAAHVYGPQKGAGADEIEQLEAGLRRFAAAIRNTLGIDLLGRKGAGAAGGLGAGLMAFAGAQLQTGVELISEAVNLRGAVEGADIVITGEGQIDKQTISGKVPVGVGRIAKEAGAVVVAVAGSIGPGASEVYEYGIDAIEPICDRPMSHEEAVERAGELVELAAERLMRALIAGRLLRK